MGGNLWRDVRLGIRNLLKKPGLSVVAILTLALGIGANAAIFSVINAVLLRPFPFPDPDRIVFIWKTDRATGSNHVAASPAELMDWRERAHAFSEISGWRAWFYTLAGTGQPEQVWGALVSANFFNVLDVPMERGRRFLPAEEQPGQDQEVILSNGLWMRRYGGDASLVGRTIRVDGRPFTVVGVLPAKYDHIFGTSREYDLYMPLARSRDQAERNNDTLTVYARIKPGLTLAQAQQDMTAVFAQIQKEYPDANVGQGIRLSVMLQEAVGRFRPLLLILLAAVGLVLLIACANVANLQLIRSASREREIATRRALGATPWRLMRQLLAENLVLGLVGGVAGILFAAWGLKILEAIRPLGTNSSIPRFESAQIDPKVLGFALALSVVTAFLFGMAPAVQVIQRDFGVSLKEGGRSGTGSKRARRMRGALVVCEVAISMVLLAGAGLLIRSFARLIGVNPGIKPDHVFTAQVWLPEQKYADPARVAAFDQQMMERTARLPGVEVAGAVSFLPLSGWMDFTDFRIEGRPAPTPDATPFAEYRVITPNYLRAVGIPLLGGRDFNDTDAASAPGVAIISETLARQYFPLQSAVGQQLTLQFLESKAPWRPFVRRTPLTIVGIAGNVHEWEAGDPNYGVIYLPYLQNPTLFMHLTLRTAGDPLAISSAVRDAVASVDKDQGIMDVKSLDQLLAEAISDRRFNMMLLGAFAALAVILAAIGLYGVLAYAVAARTQELGIRMAVGAQKLDVLYLVLREGMALAVLGALLGLTSALLLSRYLASELYGVSSTDPLTLSGVVALLLVVAALACYIPARRASRVDPIVALRYE